MLFLPVVLAGCFSTAENMLDAGASSGAAGESLVYGRVPWIQGGKETSFEGGMLSPQLNPHLLRMSDRSRIVGDVDSKGYFLWSLEPGVYVVNKIRYRDPWSGEYFVVPKMAFRLPEAGRTFYVGTLRAEFAGKRDILGGLGGQVRFSVVDEMAAASVALQARSGEDAKGGVRALMVHEEALPGTIDTTAEFNAAMAVLNAVLFGVSQ